MTLQTMDPAAPAEEPPARDQLDEAPTTATRYLCVGAYVDAYFRDRCLREVYHQAHRLVAPSYGFDLVTVLWHCLRARRLAIWQDASIVAALAVTGYLDWRALAAVGAALVALLTTRTAVGIVGDHLRRVRTGKATDTTRSARRALALLVGWAAAWTALAALIAVVLGSASRSLGLPRHLGVGAAIAAALTVFALPCVFALWKERRMEAFAWNRQAPPAGSNARLRDIDEQKSANTVVYSNFEPFIGSGDVFATWGFAIRLVHRQPDLPDADHLTEGEREFDKPPFTAEEIVSYVREHLLRLTSGEAETSIPQLTVVDRVFLSAREYGAREWITSPDRMSEIIRSPTEPARHYLVCQVVSWGGEVVTTVHVHIAVQGRSLYLEVTTTSMAPCNERYRVVDLEGGQGPRAWIRAFSRGLRETPRTIVRAPGRLVRALFDAAYAGGPRRRRPADLGARVSVRQLGTKDKLRNFTQRQDVLKFRRLLENRVYAHVLDFLDERDVDTTEYRARSASVLNIGMINHGEATVHGNVTGAQKTEQTDS